jgi:hypothetical protein
MNQHTPPFADAAAACFDEDLRAVLTAVDKLTRKSMTQKASINWLNLGITWEEVLRPESNERWRETFVPVMTAMVGDTGKMWWRAKVGAQFNVRNLLAERWFQDYTLNFAKPINATTSGMIHAIIAQAAAEGWSNPKLKTTFRAVFKKWADDTDDLETFDWLQERTPPHRAALIARTETVRLANAGTHALFANWQVAEKIWSASIDGKERATHNAANRQKVAITEQFTVGGYKMQHPGDMSFGAPIDEIANCRCALVPGAKAPKSVPTSMVAAPAVADPDKTYKKYWDDAYYDVDEEFDKLWKKRVKKWTDEELHGVTVYTGADYGPINRRIRRKEPLGEYEAVIREADDALDKFSLEEDTELYRGVGNSYFNWLRDDASEPLTLESLQRLMGLEITERSFGSSSINPDVAIRFAVGDSGNRGSTVFVISAPKGLKGAYVESITENPYEYEFLMARGVKLRFDRVEVNPKWGPSKNENEFIIHATIVSQEAEYDYDR